MKLSLLTFILSAIVAIAGDLPRPQEVRALIGANGIDLSWTLVAPHAVVQIQRYVDGRKDARYILPMPTMNWYQMAGQAPRSLWTDTDRFTNATISYRVRFKLGNDTGPWSVEVEAPK